MPVSAPPVPAVVKQKVTTMREHAKRLAALMGQLANENRLLILCALLEGPMTVGELSRHVPDITAPALSQHLHKLRDAGLICSEKHAQYIRYSICDQRIRGLMDLLKREYCPNHDQFN